MTFLALLLSLAALIGFAALMVRLYRDRDMVVQSIGGTSDDELGPGVLDLLTSAIDTELRSWLGDGGLAQQALTYREPHDPARTVEELVRHLLSLSKSRRFADLAEQVKYLYELQYTLGPPTDRFDRCLAALCRQLQAESVMDKKVGRVSTVRIGDLVDTRIMFPLNAGSRVRQPLGVVVHDDQGQVLSKAKVLCA